MGFNSGFKRVKNHEMFVVGVQVGKWSVKGGARSLLSRFIVLQFCVTISMPIRIVLFCCVFVKILRLPTGGLMNRFLGSKLKAMHRYHACKWKCRLTNGSLHIRILCACVQVAQIFRERRSHFKMLCARRAT